MPKFTSVVLLLVACGVLLACPGAGDRCKYSNECGGSLVCEVDEQCQDDNCGTGRCYGFCRVSCDADAGICGAGEACTLRPTGFSSHGNLCIPEATMTKPVCEKQ